MFDSKLVIPELRKLIGWREHYDVAQVPAFGDTTLGDSSTGEYYQDYHPICDLNIVKSVCPDNQNLETYLNEKTNAAILQMCNKILLDKREARISKGIIRDTELIDTTAWINDTITGESRFVGLAIKLMDNIGLKAVIKRFSGHFTTSQDLTFYLYHSSKKTPLKTFTLSITAPDISWYDTEVIELSARLKDLSGGMYYFGYYEEDLTGFALNVSNYNWKSYQCVKCNQHSNRRANMSVVSNAVKIMPFYCINFTKLELPSPEDIIIDFNYTWGINLSMNVLCDYTQFLIDNAISMKNLIGLSVVYSILKDAQYTQNLNFIEENLRFQTVRDLEGAKDTNYVNIADQLDNEMKAVRYDQSSLSRTCLASFTYKTPLYNQA